MSTSGRFPKEGSVPNGAGSSKPSEGSTLNEQQVAAKIAFQFLPFQHETRAHAVEKDENGKKKRYLIGVSSGLAVDGHGERMTENAIKSFMEQAESGEILLYPDVHGVRATDDVGKLVKAEILPNGDWKTHYQLYDGSEGAQDFQVQRATALWNQTLGLAPYTKARQKGFSVEGNIPPDGVQFDQHGKRTIDKVLLDGVVVVPKPAYTTSVAMAVYKALGEKTPAALKASLVGKFGKKISEREVRDHYHSISWELRSILDECISDIMKNESLDLNEKRTYLDEVCNEYKSRLMDLVLESEAVFREEATEANAIAKSLLDDGERPTETVLRNLGVHLNKLAKSLRKEFIQ